MGFYAKFSGFGLLGLFLLFFSLRLLLGFLVGHYWPYAFVVAGVLFCFSPLSFEGFKKRFQCLRGAGSGRGEGVASVNGVGSAVCQALRAM